MSNILVLSSVISVSSGVTGTYTLFPGEPSSQAYTVRGAPSPYALYDDDVYEYGSLCDGEVEIAELQKRIQSANAVFGTALTVGVAGVITTSVGLAVAIVGVIPALFGDSALLVAGSAVAGIGAGIVTVALPIAVTASFIGNASLRQAGVPSSAIPGWISIAGVGTTIVGLAMDNGDVIAIGLAATLGGGIVQAIVTNRSFNVYKRQVESTEQATLSLQPYVFQDGYGLGLSGRF